MGLEKDMALEKRHGAGKKGMALGKRGMARRHAKRGWGKHYFKSSPRGPGSLIRVYTVCIPDFPTKNE